MISSRVGIGRLWSDGVSCKDKKEGRDMKWVSIVPFLSTNLACRACLRTYQRAELVNFFNDETLHTLDRVFFLEAEIKFLSYQKKGNSC